MPEDPQPALFDRSDEANVQDLIARKEDQWFDRKSIRTKSQDLAEDLIGFANADGGSICIGLSSGNVEGVNGNMERLNDLLQATLDHTEPTVRQTVTYRPCTNAFGKSDRLLILEIEASERVHRTKNGRCFLRVGDETRRLGLHEERELSYDKGESQFDRTVLPDSQLADLDPVEVSAYSDRVGASDSTRLLVSRSLYTPNGKRTGITMAGLLLLGLHPPVNSYLRYIRH